MSLVIIKLLAGFLNEEQKHEMIERVTQAVLSVEGEAMRPLTWVMIDDQMKSGDWGVAGHGITVEKLHEIRSLRARH